MRFRNQHGIIGTLQMVNHEVPVSYPKCYEWRSVWTLTNGEGQWMTSEYWSARFSSMGMKRKLKKEGWEYVGP